VQCATFFIQGYNPPFLIFPPDGHTITEESLMSTLFQWTPVNPLPSDFMPYYRFGIFELFEGQEPREVLSVNPTIYEELIPGETQMIWPAGIILPPSTSTFVWSVQALSQDLLPMTGGDGWSEPSVIIILEDTVVYTGDTSTTIPKVHPEYVDTTTTIPKVHPEYVDTTTTIPKVHPEYIDTTTTIPKVHPEYVDTTATVPKVHPEYVDTTGTTPKAPPEYADTTGTADTIITEAPVPRMISDPTKPITEAPPGTSEPPRSPPPEFPPEYPPDTITQPYDCVPRFTKDPANPVKLGMVVEQPGLFPYPRGVPIRAEGVDFDYAIFHCIGCDGHGRFLKAVEDHVENFTWKLNGKGSLNSPFDAQAIQANADSVKNIMARLQAIDDSLAMLSLEIDSLIPKRIRDAENRLVEKQEEKTAKDSVLTLIRAKRDSITSKLDSISSAITSLNSRIHLRQDSINRRLQEIDTLNSILQGKPSQAMTDQLDLIAGLREQLNEIAQQLDDKINEISSTGETLARAILDADSLTRIAVLTYQDLRTQTEALSLQITDIETILMSNPLFREFFKRKREWNMKVFQFNWYYHGGDSIGQLIPIRKAEINNKATHSIIISDQNIRQSRYQEFLLSMTSFKNLASGSCSHLSGDDYSHCTDAAQQVLESSDNYSLALDTLTQSNYVYDLGKEQQQDSLRLELASLELAILEAKLEAENLAAIAVEARQGYVTEMDLLEEEKRDIEADLLLAGDSLAKEEMHYEFLKKVNADSLEKNRQKYLDQIHLANIKIHFFNQEISKFNDTLQALKLDSLNVNAQKKHFDQDVKEKEIYLERLGELIANLEKLIEKLNNDIQRFTLAKARLEKEKEDLLKLLEEEKNKQQQQFTGNKTASGIFVYYIPPPLEDIMKDKEEFERLKKEVEMAEDSLAIAYDFKQQVQFKLVKDIEKIARNLKKFAEIDTMISIMEDRKVKLADDITKLKHDKVLEQGDKQAELQRILEEAGQGKQTAEDSLDVFEQDSLTIREDLEYLKEALEQKDTVIAQAERNVKDMNAQLQYEEGLLRNARQTLETRSAELAEKRSLLNTLEESMGRAKNELTRAHAKDEETAIKAAKQEISSMEDEIKAVGIQITTLQASVNSAASGMESAQLRVSNAEVSLTQAIKNLSEEKKLRMVLEDGVINKHAEMEGVMSGLQHWRKTRDFASNLEDKVNQAREQLQELISEGIDTDEQVAALNKELEGLEERIGKAEEAMAALVSASGKVVENQEKIISGADEKLQAAKEKLEKAEKDLRDFLIREFETVKLEVSIDLIGDDVVVDGYRSDDDEVKMTKTLEYRDSRIPVFENEYAVDSLDDKKFGANCDPRVSFDPAAPPVKVVDPQAGKEPRTIALVYKNGKPIWPEWPVIPQGKPLLAKDVVPASVAYSADIDTKRHICLTSDPDCITPAPRIDGITDLGIYFWDVDGKIISHHPKYNRMMWEPPIIPKPYAEQEKKLDCDYVAAYLAADPPVKARSKPVVKPGTLLEVTDSIVGAPESFDTIYARVVTGDHKGLAGEDIEFSLVRESGESEGYGFEGTDTLKVKQTDGQGYAKVEFKYGDGFAKFKIFVKWKRGDKVIEEDNLYAIAPIRLQFVRFSSGISTEAWQAGLELYESGEQPDEARMESLAAQIGLSGEEADSTKDLPVHAIVGLLDEERGFVKEELVIFEPPAGISLEPDTAETAAFGLARTAVKDVPPDAKIKMTASVEDKYKAVGRPASDNSELSTTKIDRFKIGSKDNPFVIILDEPVSEGEEVNGTGMLGAEIADGLMISLKDISLSINEVELEGALEDKTAVSGTVSWAAEAGITASILAFDLTMDSLVITASMGAGIGGQISHNSLPTPVKFYGEMEPTGDFLGTLSDLPEVELAGFKIREGTSFTVDMHTSSSPSGFEDVFKGIIIHSTSIELPAVFNTNEDVTPSVLHAEDLFIGNSGIGGVISYSGTLLKFGFAGCEFEIDSVMIDFENDSVKRAAFGGGLALPSPFEGKVRALVSKAGDSWAGEITTDDPVSIPRLATVFSLQEGTGLEYNSSTSMATFRLNAVISSEKYGDIEIHEFIVNSEGEISAKNISVNKAIEFGSGFSLHVDSLSFLVAGDEYNLKLVGGFSFPLICIDSLKGAVTINPGPAVSVRFDKAVISFKYNPVEFTGSFAYNGNEFRGQFEITLENLKQIKGISGLLIIGSTESAPEETYTYWYAEIVLAGAVPLGQTGLSLLELGGGVGYNYNPPVGSAPGSPAATDAFSFKAIIGMGTAPGGEIMAGRMELILAGGYFTLYGKLWILEQRESMYGEGRLSIFWSPSNKLEGFVAMFIGIPDADGDVLFFEGKINYLYSEDDKYIRSEKIEGAFLQALHANASIDVTNEHIKLDGRLYYNLNTTIPLAVVKIIATVNVEATGHFYYIHSTSSLSAGIKFHGDWDVDLDTPLGVADIISGAIDLMLQLQANPDYIEVQGSAAVSWSIWFYSGSIAVDAGYRADL
jgi:chromosome segregation ATPase